MIILSKNIFKSSLSLFELRDLEYLKILDLNITSCWKDIITFNSKFIFIKLSSISNNSRAIILRRLVKTSFKILIEEFNKKDDNKLISYKFYDS